MEKSVYDKLAESIGIMGSAIIPRAFEYLLTTDQANVLLSLSSPMTVAQLSKKAGKSESDVQEMVDYFFQSGLVFKRIKNNETQYYRFRHVIQFHDATTVDSDTPVDYLELWKRFKDEEWEKYGSIMSTMLPKSVFRIVPVNISVQPNSEILTFEDVQEMISNAEKIAVTNCTCRNIDGACGKTVETCIQLDKAAYYALERGTGRELNKDEALDLLKKCEEEGLIHCADNKKSDGRVICNCCFDCCVMFSHYRKGVTKFVSPSRFTASINPMICSGCMTCHQRCYFEAITNDNDECVSVVDKSKCMGCGLCTVTCTMDAITMTDIREPDFIPDR